MLGILLGSLSVYSVVKAGFLTYRGEVTIKVLKDYSVKADISLDVYNTSVVAINADRLAIKLLGKHLKNTNIVVTQNAPVGFYVLNDSEGAWLRVHEKEGQRFVLNPGEHFRIYANGDIESPYEWNKGGLYLLDYPVAQENVKLKVFVDKSIPLGSNYKFKLYKQRWKVIDFGDSGLGQLILLGHTKDKVGFVYELASKYSYILPASHVPCAQAYLIAPKVSYLFLDKNGMFVPYLTASGEYVSYVLKVVDLKCLSSISDSEIYAGFKWNAIEQIATPVVFKWSNGQIYQLVNEQFVKDKADKYGILFFPVRSCQDVKDCFVGGSLLLGNLTFVDTLLPKDYKGIDLGCNLFDIKSCTPAQLEYHGNVLFNASNKCTKISRVLCGSVNLLNSKQLILMPKGSYKVKCSRPVIGLPFGVLKSRGKLSHFKGILHFMWYASLVYLLVCILRLVTCYNKKV